MSYQNIYMLSVLLFLFLFINKLVSQENNTFLLKPTGKYNIGTTELFLTDSSRKEELKSFNNGFRKLYIKAYSIKKYKYSINMTFGKVLNPIIANCENDNADLNDLTEIIALSIDYQICKNYLIRSVNYIASDLLSKRNKFFNKEYNEQ